VLPGIYTSVKFLKLNRFTLPLSSGIILLCGELGPFVWSNALSTKASVSPINLEANPAGHELVTASLYFYHITFLSEPEGPWSRASVSFQLLGGAGRDDDLGGKVFQVMRYYFVLLQI
jgi:hypothetical protein